MLSKGTVQAWRGAFNACLIHVLAETDEEETLPSQLPKIVKSHFVIPSQDLAPHWNPVRVVRYELVTDTKLSAFAYAQTTNTMKSVDLPCVVYERSTSTVSVVPTNDTSFYAELMYFSDITCVPRVATHQLGCFVVSPAHRDVTVNGLPRDASAQSIGTDQADRSVGHLD